MPQNLNDLIDIVANANHKSDEYLKVPKSSILEFNVTTDTPSSTLVTNNLVYVQDSTTMSTPTWTTDYSTSTGTYTIMSPSIVVNPGYQVESRLYLKDIIGVSELTTKQDKISFLLIKELAVSIFIRKGKSIVEKRPQGRFFGNNLYYLNKDEVYLAAEGDEAFLLLGSCVKKEDLSLVIKLLLNLKITNTEVAIPEKETKDYKKFASDFEIKINGALREVEIKEEEEDD